MSGVSDYSESAEHPECPDQSPTAQLTPLDPADQTLVQFLRQHRPLPPMADLGRDEGLEERLMAQLQNWPPTANPTANQVSQRQWGWFGGAIVVVLTAAIGGYTAVRLGQPQPTMAELEGFMETSWRESVSSNPGEFGLYMSAMPMATDVADQGRSQ